MTNLNTKMPHFQTSICVVINSDKSKHDLEECIDSALQLSSNCMVVDFGTIDEIAKIAEKKQIKVIQHPFINYIEPVRNFEIQSSDSEWVFLMDEDERITTELADEIKNVVTSEEFSYYRLPRKEYFAKKVWLKNGGWWPNTQIRLIKKSAFIDWPAQIHSFPKIEGNEGQLNNALLHYSKNDYEQIVNKTINFEDIESDLLFKADKPVNTLTFFRKFLGELYRRLIKAKGYKDGTIGVIESIYQAFSKTITYLYLYEKKNSRTV
ncbi:MAG: glycosyltransferase family 2 protein [Patescibacteria group bacterium]